MFYPLKTTNRIRVTFSENWNAKLLEEVAELRFKSVRADIVWDEGNLIHPHKRSETKSLRRLERVQNAS